MAFPLRGPAAFADAPTAYGTPDDFKRLIEEAHGRGLMVLLDVVYNHFGPEGNQLHRYAPQFFTEARETPWGAAINFDGKHSGVVRDFFIHNALYWVHEFHLDGLRLDAVHAIHDDSPTHIVRDIAQALVDGPGRDRHVHLVLENERNDPRLLDRGAPHATAQWNDPWHHCAHVLCTGETSGYYGHHAGHGTASRAILRPAGFASHDRFAVLQNRPGRPRHGSLRPLPPEA